MREGTYVGAAPLPANEADRLKALVGYRILDTAPEPEFDEIARLAKELCDVPMAFVTFIDAHRQWFKAVCGADGIADLPRASTICTHALGSPALLEIPDTTLDSRSSDNPQVTGPPYYRFYAAAPLVDRFGYVLGSLCVVDFQPRELSEEQRTGLSDLATSVIELIERRYGHSREDGEQLGFLPQALQFAVEPIAILKVDPAVRDSTIVYVNEAFSAMFGYSPADIIGKAPSMFFGAKTDRNAVYRIRAASLARQPAFETLFLYTSRRVPKPVEIHDRSLSSIYRILNIKDVSRREASQQALLSANRRLASLFANTTDAILTLDPVGTCSDANAAALTLFEASRDELLGFGYLEFMTDGIFPSGELFPESLWSGEPLAFDRTRVRRDGSIQFIDCLAIPIALREGCDGAFVVAKDVTESTRTTRQLHEQVKRTHALCAIAATEGLSEEEQIERALHIVLDALDMQFGYVGELVENHLSIRYAVGDAWIEPGALLPIDSSSVREKLKTRATFTVADVGAPDVERSSAFSRHHDWHGYIAATLSIHDTIYGAVGFLAHRTIVFDTSDVEFITLVAALIAATLERKVQREKLDELAYSDSLTRLPNRARCLMELDSEVRDAGSRDRAFAVHFIDLDGFKAANDRFGHAVGDAILQEVARRLRVAVRPGDTAGRLGGDEFVVLQRGVTTMSEPEALGLRLVEILSLPYDLDGEHIGLSASVGIAVFPVDGVDTKSLLHHADRALYEAKASGKSRATRVVSEPHVVSSVQWR